MMHCMDLPNNRGHSRVGGIWARAERERGAKLLRLPANPRPDGFNRDVCSPLDQEGKSPVFAEYFN